mmetsp:Transcript_45560/g.95648  ORF Transcript_45560/g.95648 Transcript_45560/m.95648 type:complete len:96 (+) Transcript_45560:171-458(+)
MIKNSLTSFRTQHIQHTPMPPNFETILGSIIVATGRHHLPCFTLFPRSAPNMLKQEEGATETHDDLSEQPTKQETRNIFHNQIKDTSNFLDQFLL